jgi:toxin ParE1/3/4
MANAPLTYELSLEADKDLEGIYDYTVEMFGVEQAARYLSKFEIVFESLCLNPKSGRGRDEIRKGLRSMSVEHHSIFYRVLKSHLRIVRVLHSSRDIIRFLRP